MGFKSVNELSNLVVMKEVDESVEGIYLRKFEHVLKGGDKVNVYEFESPKKELFQLMGNGALNMQMDKCEVGDRLLVVYKGMISVPNPKAKGEMCNAHSYDVQKWED